ncbi:MAG: gamma-glutamyltransferase family protein [Chloroflexi bacterium]|nr:gamma-glutamyltransferase family protein [Chloroflexota bacterium]
MSTGLASYRPPVMGSKHAVSSGHYLATAAGWRMLEQGGNAIDAGVAAGIALNVVLPGSTSFGGVAPILIYDASRKQVSSISGLGRWPRAASIEYFVGKRKGRIPPGVERVVVPAAADAWITALSEFGTMAFEQVVAPALEYARDGIAVSPQIHDALKSFESNKGNFPTRDAVFLVDGRAPAVGETVTQPALARTFERLIQVERDNASKGREAALSAVRDYFYKGPIAEDMVSFVREGGGFLSMQDLADFSVGHEPPVIGRFHEFEVYTNGPWCQGPAFAETVQILADDDLRGFGHNSADYVHLIVEALKHAFADRDAYYGDPDLVDVPIRGLLEPGYARERRRRIDMDAATPAMPARGDPWRFEGRSQPRGYSYEPPPPRDGNAEPDTSYACAVDRWGNMFSATPSDGATAIVPSLGFTPSTRGSQTWLDPRHPSALQPWKRPRLTPNALLAFKDGKPWMPFGTPGGDAQIQATVQYFLNVAVFGMTPQQAAEVPRFLQWSFPDSFWPHVYTPGRLELEGRYDPAVGEELARRGHRIEWLKPIGGRANSVCGIAVDHTTGTLSAAADFRSEAYAMAR